MKRAIVTGGTGVIGTGIIETLLADGWTVASFDIRSSKTTAQHCHCDVGDESSVAAAFEKLGWDGLELLVNNAGINLKKNSRKSPTKSSKRYCSPMYRASSPFRGRS